MPHVLFVTEKWCDGNPNCGPTNSEHNLFGSLFASRLATYEGIHFDEFYHAYGIKADDAILARCRSGSPRPDLVVATPLWGSEMTPDYDTYAEIADLGIPLIFICFDAQDRRTRVGFDKLAPLSAATVVLDIADDDELFRNPRFVPLWTPQDPRFFHDSNRQRGIDVSFAGSTERYPDRQRALARLRESGINVYQTGGQRELNLGVPDYADIYRGSRICLNFSRTWGEGPHQVKGRVFEATLCGALLLEEDNPHTKKWFEPGKEYVPFHDLDDLVEKANYYLRHEAERERIARAGWSKATRFYSATRFWSTLLRLAGVKTRPFLVRLWRKVTDQPLSRLPARVWEKVWN